MCFKKRYVPKSGVTTLPDFTPDTRNFLQKEVVKSLPPPVWVEKNKDNVKHFLNGKLSQDGGGSCVAVGVALCNSYEEQKELGIFKFLSPKFIYASLAKLGLVGSGGGLDLETAFKWFKDHGTIPDILLPFHSLNEQQMQDSKEITTDLVEIAEIYKPSDYFYTIKTIDAVASTLQYQDHLVTCAIVGDSNFGPDANGIVHKPTGLSAFAQGNWYHEITFTDFLLIGGKKYLVMEHAWGNWGYNGLGYAFVGEEWFGNFPNGNPYIFGGPVYFENLRDDWRDFINQTKPVYIFTKDLKYGMENEAVKQLQACLRWDGEFNYPTNTGYFGGMTLKAVQDFQKKYLITPISGFVGELTRNKLNSLFS